MAMDAAGRTGTDMELTILGSGTCAAVVQRSMAAYHLRLGGRNILLDIGDGALRRMLEAGLAYRDISAIFISHFHIDHIGDLVPFLWATCYTTQFERTDPLDIYGPPGLKKWYAGLGGVHGEWLLETKFPIRLHELNEERVEYAGAQITTLPMNHSVPVNGYRFERDGRVFVYSGDTGPCETLIELARDADVLLVECAFPNEKPALEYHMRPQDVARVAEQAGVRKMILTHMYPECEQVDLIAQCRNPGTTVIEIAEDLERFVI